MVFEENKFPFEPVVTFEPGTGLKEYSKRTIKKIKPLSWKEYMDREIAEIGEADRIWRNEKKYSIAEIEYWISKKLEILKTINSENESDEWKKLECFGHKDGNDIYKWKKYRFNHQRLNKIEGLDIVNADIEIRHPFNTYDSGIESRYGGPEIDGANVIRLYIYANLHHQPDKLFLQLPRGKQFRYGLEYEFWYYGMIVHLQLMHYKVRDNFECPNCGKKNDVVYKQRPRLEGPPISRMFLNPGADLKCNNCGEEWVD